MRLHLVDGTFELFRAHYSKRPDHRSPDGQDVKSSLGFALSMLWLLEDPSEEVSHIAVAFDNPIVSFRNEMFAGYKTGEGIDEALAAQFDLVEEACAACGVVVWSMDRWEADDALASAAARWREDVDQVRILSPDKDLGQCVAGTRGVARYRLTHHGTKRYGGFNRTKQRNRRRPSASVHALCFDLHEHARRNN